MALVAALVLGWSPLVPASLLLAGGLYGAHLALEDARLDGAAPALAAGLIVTAELAYWSLEERTRVRGEPGGALRRAAFVSALGLVTLLLASLLLVLVDSIRTTSLALDVFGAAAAAAALVAIALVSRGPGRRGQ